MIPHSQLMHSEGFDWILYEAFNAYSQYGEDGIIAGIFRRYGMTNKIFVDVGAGDGIQYSNTRALAERGCTGLWLEADPEAVKRAQRFAPDGVTIVEKLVRPYGPDSLDILLEQYNVPHEFDLLSLDVDGYEWHIWNCMCRFWPRVVVCEFNPFVDGKYTVCPQGDGLEDYRDVQPSRRAIDLLASSKGYVAAISTHTNLIAIRLDVLQSRAAKQQPEVDAKPAPGTETRSANHAAAETKPG